MSRQDAFGEFDWTIERSSFVKALPKLLATALIKAAAFTVVFVSLLSVLVTLF
jgi:hypothetical protein